MRTLGIGLLITSLVTGTAKGASPLASFLWSARVLVVSAPAPDNPDLVRQIEAVRGAGAAERDLVVLGIEGGEARDDQGRRFDAAAIRSALSLPSDRFEAVLVGKDGGAKLRSATVIPPAKLFGVIDAMPMRRDEVGRR